MIPLASGIFFFRDEIIRAWRSVWSVHYFLPAKTDLVYTTILVLRCVVDKLPNRRLHVASNPSVLIT